MLPQTSVLGRQQPASVCSTSIGGRRGRCSARRCSRRSVDADVAAAAAAASPRRPSSGGSRRDATSTRPGSTISRIAMLAPTRAATARAGHVLPDRVDVQVRLAFAVPDPVAAAEVHVLEVGECLAAASEHLSTQSRKRDARRLFVPGVHVQAGDRTPPARRSEAPRAVRRVRRRCGSACRDRRSGIAARRCWHPPRRRRPAAGRASRG